MNTTYELEWTYRIGNALISIFCLSWGVWGVRWVGTTDGTRFQHGCDSYEDAVSFLFLAARRACYDKPLLRVVP